MNRLSLISLLISLPLISCSPTVKVETPSEPIVINLNIDIEHKVKVQIDKDLDALIDEEELF